jgi:predicted signal transduction protein with EAL and GGDEF domain
MRPFRSDRFALVVSNFDARETVITVVRRVQESLKEPFVVDGKSIPISPRVGIAVYPEHGSTANELFSHSELSVHDAEIYNTASEASLARGTVA